jgi:hypothetical protein
MVSRLCHDNVFPAKCCYSISSHVIVYPMLHYKIQKRRTPRCEHLDEVILHPFECACLNHCILNGALHKLQPWFIHEE